MFVPGRTLVGEAWIRRADWSSHSWPVLKYDIVAVVMLMNDFVVSWARRGRVRWSMCERAPVFSRRPNSAELK